MAKMRRSSVRIVHSVSVTLVLLGAAPSRAQAPCAPPKAEAAEVGAFLKAGCYKGWAHDRDKVRQTGPKPGERAPHGKVRVYYSPQVVTWLRAGRPASGLPDGAMIYKEMFDWQSEKLTGGAYMLKARGRSFDGWLWGGFSQRSGEAWGAWANPGCLNCHASADNPELTFSYLPYINGISEPATASAEEGHSPQKQNHILPPPRRARRLGELQAEPDARRGAAPAFLARYPVAWTPERAARLALPDENLADDWVAGDKGPDPFLTSPNCTTCHAADPPRVMAQRATDPKGWTLDVSPAGEWSGSLMALSGRDPVFFAQLEHEKALRPRAAAWLDDTCYGCHGVMGQRQLHLDKDAPFSHEMIYARTRGPDAKYGALARDGVSCTVCHHISKEDLGKAETLTGQFRIGPPGEIYGPYEADDEAGDIKALPMQRALGITIKGGAHLRRSALCGTCHSVLLPRVPTGGAAPRAGAPRYHEQSTYQEWQSSAYSDERRTQGTPRTCQDCHMPTAVALGAPADPGEPRPIQTKIADIEEYMPWVKASLPRRDITLPVRKRYGRHTLVGLNYFVLTMFDQFDRLLGVPQPPAAGQGDGLLPGPVLTRRETLRLAQTQTAVVELLLPPRRAEGHIEATVRVRNLAGHKLPSGVGFRRAFIEVQLLGQDGTLLWASGRTDPLGVILGPDGQPLPGELTGDPRQLQPHHDRITRQDQVQIYEERHVDDRGQLTISFLGLYRKVKDNRLLPRGFATGKDSELAPVPAAAAADPAYRDGSGSDEVRYEIPLDATTRKGHKLIATLYYQALPPYYLKSLFDGASGKETQRLYYITSRLVSAPPSPIAGWKLRIASSEAVLP